MPADIMTVLGRIAGDELGVTLPHEHLLIDLSAYVEELSRFQPSAQLEAPVGLTNLGTVRGNPYANRDNCVLDSTDLAVREIELFTRAGGRSIVDLTNSDIGRSPGQLRAIAEASGVHIVAGSGHYVNFAQPDRVRAQSLGQIADALTDEIENGIGESGVRPGIIGEIGTTMPLHPNEEKVLRASARAHARTGLTIAVHVHPPTRSGHDVLDILEDEGVDLRRVMLCHLDAALAHNDIEFDDAVEYQVSLARRGAYIAYDLCGNSGYFTDGANSWWLPSDRERCKAIARIVDAGFAGSLLISHDVGHKHYLSEYGGWGFAHVLTVFRDMLSAFGVGDQVHSQIVSENPARMLTGAVRQFSMSRPVDL